MVNHPSTAIFIMYNFFSQRCNMTIHNNHILVLRELLSDDSFHSVRPPIAMGRAINHTKGIMGPTNRGSCYRIQPISTG